MLYNIHPIFVHFPIAMLLAFSIIKLLPFKKWFPTSDWKTVERVLLVVGVFGAFAALLTGDAAEHLITTKGNKQLVEVHATFAMLSTYIYGALLLGEMVSLANTKNFFANKNLQRVSTISIFLERVLGNSRFSGILALLGLVAVIITGMLGGILVYGVTADPLAPLLLKILGITLI